MTSDTARMYIDGKWVHARGGATFDVVNPADSSVVATVSDAGPSEAQRAVEAAHGAFREWSARPARERAQVLLNIQSLMEERRDVLARLITTENGKPLEEARKEVQFALAYFGWFAEQARRVTGEWVPSPHAGKRTWVLRQPVGPVAAVTPWNFPATMVTRKIAPALAAGCSVVLKPSPATPLTALAIARIADDAGLPPGTFNVVTASPARTLQEELLNRPLIRKIAFTGSTATGRAIMAGAASQIKRLGFELGGNAPFIVFDDADLVAAVEGAVAIKYLRVAGQSCIAALRARLRRCRAGATGRAGLRARRAGRLISAQALTRIHALVEDAVRRGARLATGGHPLTDGVRARGFFYAPTVLLDATEEMAVAREEIFGPVAPILTFDTVDEVVARANATTYGLGAYVYTRDLGRALSLAERLEYGLIGVNDASGYTHEIPFGGFKQSGLGREGGEEGIDQYLETKSVVVNIS